VIRSPWPFAVSVSTTSNSSWPLLPQSFIWAIFYSWSRTVLLPCPTIIVGFVTFMHIYMYSHSMTRFAVSCLPGSPYGIGPASYLFSCSWVSINGSWSRSSWGQFAIN
jgi:hypothetical protein